MAQAALAQVRSQQLQVEDTGHSVTVPNNSVGRLMYYLQCMRDVLGDCVPAYLTNYSNCYNLSESTRQTVIGVAKEFPPSKVPLFIEVDEVPGTSSNKFLRFNSIQETVTALGMQNDGAAIVALRQQMAKQQLLEVMVYEPVWARRNYYGPLQEIRDEENRARQQQLYRQQQYRQQQYRQQQYRQQQNESSSTCTLL